MILSQAIYGGGMEKAALNAKPLWNAAKGIFNNGVWHQAGNALEKSIAGGNNSALVRGAKGATDILSGRGSGALGLAGKGLMGYGLTAMVPGLDLPGNELAMTVSTPILGAAMAAPSLISAARAGSGNGKKAIEADAREGSAAAIDDFLSSMNANPGVVQQRDGYRQFLQQNGIGFDGADAYRKNTYHGGMGGWKKLQSLFSNPQEIIDHETRNHIQQQFNKTAGVGSAALKVGGKLMSGLGSTMKWGLPPLAAYGVYDAATRDKPHDEQKAQQEGYAATQAAIQKKMEGLSSMERFALKLDPTLAAQKLDDLMPGSLKRWESKTGQKFQPGLIASTMNAWKTGGTPSYYQTDAGGNRHYI